MHPGQNNIGTFNISMELNEGFERSGDPALAIVEFRGGVLVAAEATK
jgi:hypothetical protein